MGTGIATKAVAVVCATVLAVSCIGFGIASAGANSADDALSSTTFASSQSSASTSQVSSNVLSETLVLENTAHRDISQGIAEIAEEEEQARIAAEEAARAEEAAEMEAGEIAQALAVAQGAPLAADVDFSIGKDAFIAEWGPRIDAYLAGSPLEGYGSTFAEAAWEYGIDPRWSPAISTTESTKGRHCIRAYNAWGWGANDENPYGMASEWSSWEQAIFAHVEGLSRGYGFTITLSSAKKYCPPTYEQWYATTLNEMSKI